METNFKGLGQILFGFQEARWNIVELGNRFDTKFISKEGAADFVDTASDFDTLADLRPEWQELSTAFLDATKRFNALLACTPYETADGQAAVGSSDAGKYYWTDVEIERFVQTLNKISEMATQLMAKFNA